ncbi:hypothetical protein A3K73_05940 [Candidatus Pacearchaeota archaeon RBG_13_36_9]|nr:MAG: hypothetical protein A3K73_05940 [Candidatus Pacearchaeota archaeon RBG_13_36_9]
MGKDLIKTPEASSCEVCKEEITEKVYEYSLKNFGKALCMRHQHTGNNSLSTKEKWYQENMIKGRIAETLIEELFLYLGYNVFRYGMENTVPGVMKLLKGVRGDVADNIRRMPDFVIQSNSGKNKGEVYFIEVKFRANEEFSRDELSKEYPFENCYFIVVSKKHIKCITYKELMSGKTVSPSPHNYLGDREEFELDKNVIIDFCNFAVKFFEGV